MKIFNIKKPDGDIRNDLIHKINNLTKPKGALGTLEELAFRIGLIQQTTSPVLRNPHNIIFGADHGIADEGVSVSPKEVTWQQMGHFIKGGGGINFLCRQHGFTLKVVDAGVDFDFPKDCGVIDKKVRKGTRNYLYEGAMTADEFDTCITHGADVVAECWKDGCNVVSFGEMGIGNTSSSSLLMTCLTGIPLEKCVGAGSGLDNAGIRHKLTILQQALDKYKGDTSCVDYMCYFGGLEMAMAVGGMLQAAEKHMIILVDGFIMTNCIWVAARIYPEVMDYAIFGHQGDEAGHRLLLEKIGVKPLLNLGLRLGEGSGAVCAYPIVDSAVRMINEMDTFDKASITKYF